MITLLRDPRLSETGGAAVLYAQEGWSVFPIWWTTPDGRCACPGGSRPEIAKDFCGRTGAGETKGSPGKHPIASVARRGVKDATRDPRVVASQWTRYPLARIGLPAGGNRLSIVDVDLDKSGTAENFDKLCSWALSRGVNIRNTLTSATGGGGYHYIFAAPLGEHASSCDRASCDGCIKNGQGNKPPFGASMTGIDTRGCGGYIVAPPSTHISGRLYEWVNPWTDPVPWPNLLTRAMEFAARPPAPVNHRPIRRRGDGSRYAEAALARELDELAGVSEGGRNGALNRSAFNLGQLVGARLLGEQDVRENLLSVALSIGLTETESHKTINSGITRGMAKPRQVAA